MFFMNYDPSKRGDVGCLFALFQGLWLLISEPVKWVYKKLLYLSRRLRKKP